MTLATSITTLLLAVVVLLLVLSAFLTASSAALTAASRTRMHALENEGNQRAGQVGRLLATPGRIIGTVLLGNTLAVILASSLMTSLLTDLAGPAGVLYATAIMTVVVVIFCEVLPRTCALAYPDRMALLVAPIMGNVVRVLRPVTASIELIVRQLLALTPSKRDDESNILAAHEEIRDAIELQTQGGAVARGEAHMLGGVLDLRDLQVLDIMVHRTKMDIVNADDPPQKIIDEVVRSQCSRVPIWKGQPENIVGILHTKDMLAVLVRLGWDVSKLDIMSFAVEPWFIPDTTSVKEQLNQFLRRKAQLALVVDEYGEVQGLITLEDILEEIVGQIADEHDNEGQTIRVQPDGTVNVDGSVAIRDVNRHMDWDLPDKEATTVAGLVIHEAQTIPEPGQAFTFYGYRFEILRRNRNRITAIRIEPLATPAARSDIDRLGGG